MRIRYLLLVMAAVTVALFTGWVLDRRIEQVMQSPLQVPDNIDYYLAQVNYRVFDQHGNPSYQLKSPYVEHFIREDISLITEPSVRYFKNIGLWAINATNGSLNHPLEQLTLTDAVHMHRLQNASSFLLTTEKVIFSTQSEQVEIPQELKIKTDNMMLEADFALMDIKNERHQFHRVRAIYEPKKNNEPS